MPTAIHSEPPTASPLVRCHFGNSNTRCKVGPWAGHQPAVPASRFRVTAKLGSHQFAFDDEAIASYQKVKGKSVTSPLHECSTMYAVNSKVTSRHLRVVHDPDCPDIRCYFRSFSSPCLLPVLSRRQLDIARDFMHAVSAVSDMTCQRSARYCLMRFSISVRILDQHRRRSSWRYKINISSALSHTPSRMFLLRGITRSVLLGEFNGSLRNTFISGTRPVGIIAVSSWYYRSSNMTVLTHQMPSLHEMMASTGFARRRSAPILYRDAVGMPRENMLFRCAVSRIVRFHTRRSAVIG